MIQRAFTSAILLLVLFVATPFCAANEIHYVGFNRFAGAGSGAQFDDYIKRLRPIMRRYDMTVETFDVLHGGSDDLAADVITFGTAVDEESFHAFFQDPEFQNIFPLLIEALAEHEVIFTAGPFGVTGVQQDHTWLALSWVGGDEDASTAKLVSLNETLEPVFSAYGVAEIATAKGVTSNRGLVEVAPGVAPHLIELWSIRDAHGYFDDPLFKTVSEQVKQLLSRSESFWLTRRDIR